MRLFLLGLVLLMSFWSAAQMNTSHTVGLRLGASEGFGAEISYQYALTEANRLELNFGWRSADSYDGFRLVGLYQWVHDLSTDLNWYYGGGLGLSSYNYNTGDSDTLPFFTGVAGIEFKLKLPVIISLDLRPQLNVASAVNFLDLDFGVGVRYAF
jgi:hypothetical protein